MVITPDLVNLPFVEKGGIKYFELVAEPVQRQLLPGLFIKGWGYNGSIPGPTIQVFPGDYVYIRVHNRLPEATSIHWHGLNVPNIMDGVPDVEPSPRIEPGSYFDYHFRITNPPGTHIYHTHVNTHMQEMMGMSGGFIILDPVGREFNRDYLIMLQEFTVKGVEKGEVKPGLYDVDPMSDDFNFFTMNGRCFPVTTPLRVHLGEQIRIRLLNTMMNAHPIHIHGHQFTVISSDGNEIKPQNRLLKNTIHVAPGETWDIAFNANNPGIWPFHCHIPHHMSNNFTPGSGGMFTTIVYE